MKPKTIHIGQPRSPLRRTLCGLWMPPERRVKRGRPATCLRCRQIERCALARAAREARP